MPPELPPLHRSPAESFVDLTAKLSLVLGVLGAAWCAFQLLLVAVLGRLNIIDTLENDGIPVPSWARWLSAHAVSLSVVMLLVSLLFVVVCQGMLKRREWGRIGFIVFLVLVAVANFACIPLMDGLFTGMQSMMSTDFLQGPQAADMHARMAVSRWTSLTTLIASSVAIAALHGWLAIKLQRREIRALFH